MKTSAADGALSPLQRAALAMREMRLRLDRVEGERREPIAIVGVGCRFPGGASTPADFWTLLCSGRDASGDWPADRWDVGRFHDSDPDRAGTIYTRRGSFLDRVDGFDARFFDIAPREAESLDPQQRLLLEVGWEALEHGGIAPDGLRETRTGVFVGIGQNDYARRRLLGGDAERIGAYDGTGNGFCFAVGRLSYVLGLQGPNVAIDTACSSSLVAVHLACQSLRGRECDLALAGGVQLILAPEVSVFLSRARALSPDGRCRTFDAGANGYGRGEGCGIVALKRLADARRDGDRIVAVIRGSAVNHDGPSSGLTVPSAPAQQRLMREALERAALQPGDIDYVEAHGTATALGDPIEIAGLEGVFASRAPDQPLRLGSVKTNIGHLEAAAGIAGLIKVALALEHEAIPPHLHVETPNPAVPWKDLPFRITSALEPWRAGERVRRGGISSFGISGTNAHVILEEAPGDSPADAPAGTASAPEAGPYVLRLAARSEPALREMAERHAAHVAAHREQPLADVCATANAGRADGRERGVVVAASRDAMVGALTRLARGEAGPGIARGRATGVPRIGFLYTGQGAQSAGMGRALYETEPACRETVDRCAAAVSHVLDADLRDVLYGTAGDRLREPVYTQLGLFAVACGLTAVWRAWGVTPWGVLGHSVGEYAAAVTAGVLDLESAARLLARRAQLMAELPEVGTMAAVQGDPALVERLVAETPGVSVAAYNGPEALVVSGPVAAVRALGERLADDGLLVTPLQVAQGYHSALMTPMLRPFEADVRAASCQPPRLRFVSTVTGARIDARLATPGYWVEQVLAPVRFDRAVASLHALGCDLLVEIGPRAVLTTLAQRLVPGVPCYPSLRGAGDARAEMLDAAARVHVEGAPLDWTAMQGAAPTRRVALPTYPWQRERYWIDWTAPDPVRAGAGALHPPLHPLLHRRLRSPVARPEIEFETTIDRTMSLAADHLVRGEARLPAAAYIEMALAGAREAGLDTTAVEDVQFHRSMELGAGPSTVRLVLTPAADGTCGFEIFSEADGHAPWTRHASGRVTRARPAPAPVALDDLRARLGTAVAPGPLYETLRGRGLELARSFVVLGEMRASADEALARLDRRADAAWLADPALVDGCSVLHSLMPDTASGLWAQVGVGRLTPYGPLSSARWAYLTRGAERGVADLLLLDDAGGVVLGIERQQLRPVASGVPATAGLPMYELAWILAPASSAAAGSSADAARYREAERELEALSAGFVASALPALRPDDGIPPQYRRLAARLEEVLAADPRPGEAIADPVAYARQLGERYPVASVELELLARCGSNLPGILQGKVEPLALLFPEDATSAAALYSTSHAAQVMNGLLRTAVSAEIAARADERPLRVLEIGAGTGSATAVVLDLLPSDAEYWFTDVAPVFVQQARGRFEADGRVRVARLDIEHPPGAQGIEDGGFDLVVASNVLHATRSLAGTLAHVRRLLRPGGALVLMEGTERRAWVDLIFGLTEGWWRFEDADVRASHPLVPVAAWRALLEAAGFESPAVWPETPGPAGQTLLVAARADAPRHDAARRPVRADNAGSDTRWILVGGEPAAAGHLAAALTRRGAACQAVGELTPDVLFASGGADVGLVCLPAAPPAHATANGPAFEALAAAEHARAIVSQVARSTRSCAIWFVTSGVNSASGTRDAGNVSQAPLWGIARTLALEAPELWGGAIDVADRDWAASADRVAAALLERAPGDDLVVLRDEARLVPRVRALESPAVRPPSLGGTWLVTGGFGAFGLATAEYLASRGVTRIGLVGRRGPASAPARETLERLQAMGVEPLVFAADVTNEAEMRAVIEAAHVPASPLRGVVHAAGLTGYGLLRDTPADAMAGLLRPKVVGGWLLHRLTAEIALEHFVCYSSMVSVWGARGQGPYVAANQFLDTLAHHRRAQGLPAVTVNWGPLSGGGMVPGAVAAELVRMGVESTPMREAVAALDRVLDGRVAQAIVVDIDWERFRGLHGAKRRTSLFDLVQAPTARVETAVQAPGRDLVLRALPAERRDVLTDELRRLVGQVVNAQDAIDGATGFFDLGLDSLGAMELRRLLERHFGFVLPSTLLFDCGTLEALTDDLWARLDEATTAPRMARPAHRLQDPGSDVSGAGPFDLDALSEEELETRLLQKLQELE